MFVLGLDRLVEPLRSICTMKLKAHCVKQEFEKHDELKRSALRAVCALLTIPDAGRFLVIYINKVILYMVLITFQIKILI